MTCDIFISNTFSYKFFLQPQWIKSSLTIPALITVILCNYLKNVNLLPDSWQSIIRWVPQTDTGIPGSKGM